MGFLLDKQKFITVYHFFFVFLRIEKITESGFYSSKFNFLKANV